MNELYRMWKEFGEDKFPPEVVLFIHSINWDLLSASPGSCTFFVYQTGKKNTQYSILVTENSMSIKKAGMHHNDKGGPAYICMTGRCEYAINGKLHRTDGPAVTTDSETKEQYWLDGKLYQSKAAWVAAVKV